MIFFLFNKICLLFYQTAFFENRVKLFLNPDLDPAKTPGPRSATQFEYNEVMQKNAKSLIKILTFFIFEFRKVPIYIGGR